MSVRSEAEARGEVIERKTWTEMAWGFWLDPSGTSGEEEAKGRGCGTVLTACWLAASQEAGIYSSVVCYAGC